MSIVMSPIDMLSMSRPQRNQVYRMIGHTIRSTGGTYCYWHGLDDVGCTECGPEGFPDLSVYVFGELHKKSQP